MKIVLEVHKSKNNVGDIVRITKEAQDKLSEIMLETGRSAKYIVSQMIIQGSNFLEIKEG